MSEAIRPVQRMPPISLGYRSTTRTVSGNTSTSRFCVSFACDRLHGGLPSGRAPWPKCYTAKYYHLHHLAENVYPKHTYVCKQVAKMCSKYWPSVANTVTVRSRTYGYLPSRRALPLFLPLHHCACYVWRRCESLCTPGFIGGVAYAFAHSGRESVTDFARRC